MPRKAHRRGRFDRRGLTLVEVTLAVAIAAMAAAISIAAVSSLTDAALHSTALELTGAIKFAYDRAIMERRTERLSIDMDKGLWWIDFSQDEFALSKEKLIGKEGEKSEDLEDQKHGTDPGERSTRRGDRKDHTREGDEDDGLKDTPSLLDGDKDSDVKAALEGGKAAQFALDTEVAEPKSLPSNVRVSKVWSGHQEEQFTSGVAYIHFFSGGWTEPAQIELTDGDELVSLKLYPLTGRVRSYDRELETPKPESDDGREEGDE